MSRQVLGFMGLGAPEKAWLESLRGCTLNPKPLFLNPPPPPTPRNARPLRGDSFESGFGDVSFRGEKRESKAVSSMGVGLRHFGP